MHNTPEDKKNALNQIFYGPPGTGKTYKTVEKALELLNESVGLSRSKNKERFEQIVDEGRIIFTTFHQSMSYEDFVEGIKPNVIEDEGGNHISYKITAGIFFEACALAAYNY